MIIEIKMTNKKIKNNKMKNKRIRDIILFEKFFE